MKSTRIMPNKSRIGKPWRVVVGITQARGTEQKRTFRVEHLLAEFNTKAEAQRYMDTLPRYGDVHTPTL